MTTIDTVSNALFENPALSANPARPASSTIGWMLLVSVLFHGMLFLHFDQHHDKTNKTSLDRSLVISLSKITPEVPPELRQKLEKSQQSTPKQSTSLLAKESQTKSRYKLKIEQKPARQSSEYKKQLKQPAQKQTEVAAVDTALIKKTRDQYMKKLAAHLDRHKFYPRSARRRHLEGRVEVSFDLLSNGQIINLHTLSGHPVLQKATMDSIYSALPMPTRPEALLALNTMKIEYSMQYDLN